MAENKSLSGEPGSAARARAPREWRHTVKRIVLSILVTIAIPLGLFGILVIVDSAPSTDHGGSRLTSAESGTPRTSISEWPVTGGDDGAARYSPLSDINRHNVGQLEVAWTYRHGDVYRPRFPNYEERTSAFETTPLVVEGLLIFTTPFNRVIALDPITGAERWVFDPALNIKRRYSNMLNNRGVAYKKADPEAGHATGRVYLGTLDARLIALDVETGIPIDEFGQGGQVNLLQGVDGLVDSWEYNLTSPPTVIGDLVVVGSSISDMTRRIQPSGFVRAFDAHTGALRWRFNTIPHRGEVGADTWENESWQIHGGANVWSTITADADRGLLFLPVSTAGPDFYGGDRPGENWFSDSIVALDASTGTRVWHFQTVHHDIWDYDLAAAPMLVTVTHEGRDVDAVVQLTKTGLVFVLDRDTGEPIFDVEERPVPQGGVPGERTWPTQPFPTRPPPLVRHQITDADLSDTDPKRRRACETLLHGLRNDGIFTPPSEEGSIVVPGTAGGANWSGGAFDPTLDRLYVPVDNLLMTIRLEKLNDANFETNGKVLSSPLGALRYLAGQRGTGLRYAMHRDLFGIDDVQCVKPPWGKMVAVDLRAGDILWEAPIGKDEEGNVGLFSFGSPLATAGGLVFHGGTTDQHLYAYDTDTGEVLASYELPAGLHAGPITYTAGDRQYLVVAPGGHGQMNSKLGDYVIAYTLP